jgi:tRNA-dihydrouridine synthase
MDLKRPFFVLAPMDEVTDTVFRQVVNALAPPDLFFTEFVNVDGLQSIGRPKLLKKVRFAASEHRLVIQLWGIDPSNFEKTAEQIADGSVARELGLPDGCNFYGVDLNMGCPAKSEVSNGTCSALIKNRPLAAEIIAATKRGLDGRLPISVKTRVGFDEIDMSWIQFLLECGIDMLTVHGRTRREMSKVPARWDLINEARLLRDAVSPNTLIVGNGDVLTRQQGEEFIKRYKLDGIMIGRGIFSDPYIFSENSPWNDMTADQKLTLFEEHVQLFAGTWLNGERPSMVLNKFCKVYINGFDGAKELREKLMSAGTIDALLDLLASARSKFALASIS